MANHKEHPKHTVVSLRVSDAERLALEELTRGSGTTISCLMREAIQLCYPQFAKKPGKKALQHTGENNE